MMAQPDNTVPENSGEFDTMVFQDYEVSLNTFQESMK